MTAQTHRYGSLVDALASALLEKELDFSMCEGDISELKPEIWASVYGYSEIASCPGCDEKLHNNDFHAASIDKKAPLTASNAIPLCKKCDEERGETHAYPFLMGKKPMTVQDFFLRHASYYGYDAGKYST